MKKFDEEKIISYDEDTGELVLHTENLYQQFKQRLKEECTLNLWPEDK